MTELNNVLAGISAELGDTNDTDSLGGNFIILPTGLYDAVIDDVYLQASTKENSKSVSAVVVYKIENPADPENPVEHTARHTILGVDGSNLTKDPKTNKKKYLFGFENLNTLALVATGKEIRELTQKNQLVEIYDSNTRKKEPTEVPVLAELSGKKVKLLIEEQRVNKKVQNPKGEWVATNEDKQTNQVVKTVHHTGATLTEAREQTPEPLFVKAWLDKNQGKIKDKFKTVADSAVAGTPSTGAASSGTAKPLF